ncbi:MAG: hypothetical protein MRZ71_01260 [Bacteroidales bacterium]|nr:hypothetical protein [Bacteroidales bacterium]
MKTLRHLLVAALLSAPGFAMAQTNNVALNKTATADPNEGAPQLAVDGLQPPDGRVDTVRTTKNLPWTLAKSLPTSRA